MRSILFLFASLSFQQAYSQRAAEKQGGNFSIGMRSTMSAFSDEQRRPGYGVGSHFRIQFANRVNSEWFLDVLSTNIQNKAERMDYHIGWSVMYYVIDPKGFTRKVTPYVVAGHCFDYTKISINNTDISKTRGTSAVQAGMGFHYNITPKFDVSSELQYMLHLGKDLHTHISDEGMEIEQHEKAGWEGHLLFNVSVNYKFAKLWNREKRS